MSAINWSKSELGGSNCSLQWDRPHMYITANNRVCCYEHLYKVTIRSYYTEGGQSCIIFHFEISKHWHLKSMKDGLPNTSHDFSVQHVAFLSFEQSFTHYKMFGYCVHVSSSHHMRSVGGVTSWGWDIGLHIGTHRLHSKFYLICYAALLKICLLAMLAINAQYFTQALISNLHSMAK